MSSYSSSSGDSSDDSESGSIANDDSGSVDNGERRSDDGSDSVIHFPGRWELTFGKYKGQNFEDVPLEYRCWCRYSDIARGQRWFAEFKRVFKAYEAAHPPERSPGSEPIWFGIMFYGVQFCQVYHRKKWWKWLMDEKRQKNYWYWRLYHLKRTYKAWLKTHEREYRPRELPQTIRDLGDRTGPWDDKLDAPPPADEYELDGFVVPDDEVEYEPGAGAGDESEEADAVMTDGEDDDDASAGSGSGDEETSGSGSGSASDDEGMASDASGGTAATSVQADQSGGASPRLGGPAGKGTGKHRARPLRVESVETSPSPPPTASPDVDADADVPIKPPSMNRRPWSQLRRIDTSSEPDDAEAEAEGGIVPVPVAESSEGETNGVMCDEADVDVDELVLARPRVPRAAAKRRMISSPSESPGPGPDGGDNNTLGSGHGVWKDRLRTRTKPRTSTS